MNGMIVLNKPSGISSAAAVARVKRMLGEKTVGHMGTLDPMAEGVLAIGVGKATRLFDYLCGKDKTYIAKFKFGSETDTLDALGTVTATTTDIPSIDAVSNAMQSLVGRIEQVPPVYSAKHIDATLTFLRRTRSGSFRIEESVTLDDLETIKGEAVRPAETVIDLPRYDVPPEHESDLKNGRRIGFDAEGRFKIYCLGKFYGIGAAADGALKIITYLADGD